MSEDWTKLIAEAKKLEAKLKSYDLEDAKDCWKALQARDKAMEAHEKGLQKAAIAAYEEGVGSKKVEEFLKHKGFAEAKKLLDADRKLLVAELKALEAQCEKCRMAAHQFQDMIAVMDKALVSSKGKDKSPERTAAKKVRDGIYDRFRELTEAYNMRNLPDKYMTAFDGQYDKLIDHLIKEAFKKGKDPEPAAEIPQPLAEKKVAVGVKAAEKYKEAVLECIARKKDLDEKDAKFKLLTAKAWAALDDLRGVADEWKAVAKKFKKELEAADPGGAVMARIDGMEAAYMAAHKALKADADRPAKVGRVVDKPEDG